jgi:hypothetical protein
MAITMHSHAKRTAPNEDLSTDIIVIFEQSGQARSSAWSGVTVNGCAERSVLQCKGQGWDVHLTVQQPQRPQGRRLTHHASTSTSTSTSSGPNADGTNSEGHSTERELSRSSLLCGVVLCCVCVVCPVCVPSCSCGSSLSGENPHGDTQTERDGHMKNPPRPHCYLP